MNWLLRNLHLLVLGAFALFIFALILAAAQDKNILTPIVLVLAFIFVPLGIYVAVNTKDL